MVNVPYNSKLTLTDVVRKQTGIYKIIAENQHGKDEADVEVTVLGNCLFIFLHSITK